MNPARGTASNLSALQKWFQVFFGLCLGLALLKFPNPPIMEQFATAPRDFIEVIFSTAWPVGWAYCLLFLVAGFGFVCCRRKRSSVWLIYLPAVWLLWQVIASSDTIDKAVTWPTLKHLAACTACFYIGHFSLGSAPRANVLWTCLGIVMIPVITTAWSQHFGGLQQSRDYFMTYVYPTMPHVAPEYLKKLNSTRVFSTLFYPNALAGVLILITPVTLTALWQSERATKEAKAFLAGLLILGACGALYWSGSKGGWLIALTLLILALVGWPRRPAATTPRRTWTLIAIVLFIGLGAFSWKYSGFFQKGATSVVARFDYWRAAGQTALANPLNGTGPGTFAKSYARVKRPESEMARLAHNDYLQQASDSGLPGALLYAGFWLGVVAWTGAGLRRTADPLAHAVWLGLLGWVCQSFMEFGLYLPGLAWTAFAMSGWLVAYTSPVADDRQSIANRQKRQVL